MLVTRVLNQCHHFPGFVYGQARFSADNQSILIPIRPRRGSRATGSGCHRPAAGYDQARTPRHFAFMGIWGFLVFFVYSMRRVNCKRCGIVVEEVYVVEMLGRLFLIPPAQAFRHAVEVDSCLGHGQALADLGLHALSRALGESRPLKRANREGGHGSYFPTGVFRRVPETALSPVFRKRWNRRREKASRFASPASKTNAPEKLRGIERSVNVYSFGQSPEDFRRKRKPLSTTRRTDHRWSLAVSRRLFRAIVVHRKHHPPGRHLAPKEPRTASRSP